MTRTPTRPDTSKLPKWAQRRIAKLESDVEYHKAQAFQAAKGPSNSRVFIEDYEGTRGLPDNVKIGFRFAQDKVLAIRRVGDWVEVRSDFQHLVIEPESSNVIRVRSA